MFDRSSRKEVTLEASREVAKPKTMLKPRKVGGHIRNPDSARFSRKWNIYSCSGVLWREEEKGRDLCGLSGLQQEDPSHCLASTGSLPTRSLSQEHNCSFPFPFFSPGRHFLSFFLQENIIAVAATNNLFLFQVILMKFH